MSLSNISPQIARFTDALTLDSGGKLEQYEIVYETYGTLNESKSNAILICHALSGNHHAAGSHKGKDNTGWWDTFIGPNKPIDTNRFFVVCSNNLGGCDGSTGPSSLNPITGAPYGPDFPIVTVKDWVTSQAQLSDYLGIDTWAAVIGGSLGGMQALQWSIQYPKRIQNAIIIASAAKLTAQNIGFNDIARQAIRTDPNFHNGHYYAHETAPKVGLSIARMLGHITYLSDDMMAKKFGRALQKKTQLQYNYTPEFQVESYLRYQADRFKEKFDANTYLLMTKALDYFNPAAHHEDNLTKVFQHACANFLVVSFTSDWRFSPERSKEIVVALKNQHLNVSYAEITSAHGHDSFLLHIPDYYHLVSAYINRIARQLKL